MNTIQLRKISKNDYFKLPNSNKVYKRGDYVRELKRYSYSPVDDMNKEMFKKGDTEVIHLFEY